MREYLKAGEAYGGEPKIGISMDCKNLIRCIPLLRFDEKIREDAAGTPHEITHAPEALRYALMSRQPKPKPSRRRFTGSIYAFDSFSSDGEGDFASFIDY